MTGPEAREQLHRALAWCWAALSAFALAVTAKAFIGDGAATALTSCALLLTAGAAWQSMRTRRQR